MIDRAGHSMGSRQPPANGTSWRHLRVFCALAPLACRSTGVSAHCPILKRSPATLPCGLSPTSSWAEDGDRVRLVSELSLQSGWRPTLQIQVGRLPRVPFATNRMSGINSGKQTK